METICIDAYNIDELPDNKKERAYHEWLDGFHYHWHEENRASMEAFAELFPITIKDWMYGGRGEGVYYRFDSYIWGEDIARLSGFRLARWLYNNVYDEITKGKFYWNGKRGGVSRHSNIIMERSCPLTGYVGDHFLLDELYDFVDDPDGRTLNSLLQDCFNSWVKDCSEDLRYSSSMEHFEEEAKALNWKFDKRGERIHN